MAVTTGLKSGSEFHSMFLARQGIGDIQRLAHGELYIADVKGMRKHITINRYSGHTFFGSLRGRDPEGSLGG